MTSVIPTFITVVIITTAILTPLVVWLVFWRVSAQTLPQKEGQRVSATVGILLLGWWLLVVWLGIRGVFSQFFIPPIPYLPFALIIPLLIGSSGLALWPAFRQVIDAIPQHWLIGVQVTRLIGFVFLVLSARQILPDEFASAAGWGDVLTGLLALLVAYFYFTRKTGAKWAGLGWNIFGIGDLMLAVSLGFLTNPGPLQRLALDFQYTEARMVTFPLVMIPGFLVPLFLLLHVFSLRTLKREWSQPSNQKHQIKQARNKVVTTSVVQAGND